MPLRKTYTPDAHLEATGIYTSSKLGKFFKLRGKGELRTLGSEVYW